MKEHKDMVQGRPACMICLPAVLSVTIGNAHGDKTKVHVDHCTRYDAQANLFGVITQVITPVLLFGHMVQW